MDLDDLVSGATGIVINPIYVLSVTAGFAFVFLFPLTKDFKNPLEKTQYYYLQLITLLGAIIGAKFAVLMGDALWPIHGFSDWPALLYSGRDQYYERSNKCEIFHDIPFLFFSGAPLLFRCGAD